jgi:hypothetical protein
MCSMLNNIVDINMLETIKFGEQLSTILNKLSLTLYAIMNANTKTLK